MVKLAVIKTGGKQYLVREGDTLNVEKLEGEAGKPGLFDATLLAPTIALRARVTADIVAHGRAAKVTILKFKNKTRYSKKRGHRQGYTRITVKEIA